MSVFHVSAATVEGYVQKREPYRKAHIERLQKLRAEGVVRMGGPWPDGRGVDLIYRVPDRAAVKKVVEGDPYWTGGVWTSYAALPFSSFMDPKMEVPVVLDGSRRVFIVEGPAPDARSAGAALSALREQGRVYLGGVVEQRLWALTSAADEATAMSWVAAAGGGDAAKLGTRPLFYVL